MYRYKFVTFETSTINKYMLGQSNENKLIEGEDFYYTPEGYKCFTEKHHLKRGYCCKSGCRHCPYGFDKKTGTIKKTHNIHNTSFFSINGMIFELLFLGITTTITSF